MGMSPGGKAPGRNKAKDSKSASVMEVTWPLLTRTRHTALDHYRPGPPRLDHTKDCWSLIASYTRTLALSEHTEDRTQMMQPTPAPSSPLRSPKQHVHDQDDATAESAPVYPAAPQNMGSAPFGILVGLFEKLQVERKQDRRKKLVDAWFNVRSLSRED